MTTVKEKLTPQQRNDLLLTIAVMVVVCIVVILVNR